MAICQGETACLRCVFPEPPGQGELPTCDTAGVLGPLAGAVASLQAVAALKLLSGNAGAVAREMIVMDVWANRLRSVDTSDARRADCVTCAQRRFDFLAASNGRRLVSLCGRNAVQVQPERKGGVELLALADRLKAVGVVTRTPYLLKVELKGDGAEKLTVFPDGRVIVAGTQDLNRARSLCARYVGT
jgi:hypothetical protein